MFDRCPCKCKDFNTSEQLGNCQYVFTCESNCMFVWQKYYNDYVDDYSESSLKNTAQQQFSYINTLLNKAKSINYEFPQEEKKALYDFYNNANSPNGSFYYTSKGDKYNKVFIRVVLNDVENLLSKFSRGMNLSETEKQQAYAFYNYYLGFTFNDMVSGQDMYYNRLGNKAYELKNMIEEEEDYNEEEYYEYEDENLEENYEEYDEINIEANEEEIRVSYPIDLLTCTTDDLLTLDGFNKNLANKFIDDRFNGKIFYNIESLANEYKLQPHQIILIRDRLIFPQKATNKNGRKVDF